MSNFIQVASVPDHRPEKGKKKERRRSENASISSGKRGTVVCREKMPQGGGESTVDP